MANGADRPKTLRSAANTTYRFWSCVVILGIVVYAAVDIVLAFLRPDYSLLHNAESDYGRGPYFWLMDINFVLRCLFSLALVRLLWLHLSDVASRKGVCYLLSVWAVASGLLAFFADNPNGYTHLKSGSIHLLLAFIAFISVVIVMVLLSRYSSWLGLTNLASLGLRALTLLAVISILLLGKASFHPHGLGGLYERFFLGSVLIWEAVLALALGSKTPTLTNAEQSAKEV